MLEMGEDDIRLIKIVILGFVDDQLLEMQGTRRKPSRMRAEDGAEGGDSVGAPRFSLLRYTSDGRDQAYIFIAVSFLVKKFQELLDSSQEKAIKSEPNRDGHFFRMIAKNLGVGEPVLEGVTGQALWSMYDRLIKN